MSHTLEPLINPKSVVFVGGSNLGPCLRFQREIGYAGETWVVSPKYDELEGYKCVDTVADLPGPPDLAFVAVRREVAIESIAALRDLGCRAVICNAAGFSEVGSSGAALQAKLVEAAGDMPLLGPNTVGVANFAVPMAAMMQNYGKREVERGFAVVSQGGGLLEDSLFCDRDLPVTHVVGGGNQAVTGIEEVVEYLLDDSHVTAVGLAFETIRDIGVLRRAAIKSMQLGKPIVAIKFGVTSAGALAAASHTASMTGDGATWEALLSRLGIILTRSTSEFFETLKLINSGQMPRGRRVLVTSASGVQSILVADHLSAAGFELTQPSGARFDRLRELLPVMATPCNPQDVTGGAWNDEERQVEIFATLLDEDYDVAMMVQNHPQAHREHTDEYAAQASALARAGQGRDVALLELSPMLDCFPAAAREYVRSLGLAAMQGLEECVKALSHAVWYHERRSDLFGAGLESLTQVPAIPGSQRGTYLDEATAKGRLAEAGVAVPVSRVTVPGKAAEAAAAVGFPVAIKALDARLLHKTELGAVRIGLSSAPEVQEAVDQMRIDMKRLAPDIPFEAVLVEAMAQDVVVELMASVTRDPTVGTILMIAGGGIEAELWNDSAIVAAPFNRREIERALDGLKVARRLDGWRGRPPGDRDALLDLLEALVDFAMESDADEVEVNPILVSTTGALAVDALLKVAEPTTSATR